MALIYDSGWSCPFWIGDYRTKGDKVGTQYVMFLQNVISVHKITPQLEMMVNLRKFK